jgi:hypothetical protein
MVKNAVKNFLSEIEAFSIVFKVGDNAEALRGMVKSFFYAMVSRQSVKYSLSHVAEGSMSKVVPQCNGFGQILIET